MARIHVQSSSQAAANETRNAFQLGPRTRLVIRAVARAINPIVLAIAGRRFMPIVGRVQHRGRRSGRLYLAPLGVRPLGDGFVMPVTFGADAHWYQNIRAAGWCVITYRGTERYAVSPMIVDRETALPAFPRYERSFLRLLGIRQFLSVVIAPAGWTPGPAAPAEPVSDPGETS